MRGWMGEMKSNAKSAVVDYLVRRRERERAMHLVLDLIEDTIRWTYTYLPRMISTDDAYFERCLPCSDGGTRCSFGDLKAIFPFGWMDLNQVLQYRTQGVSQVEAKEWHKQNHTKWRIAWWTKEWIVWWIHSFFTSTSSTAAAAKYMEG